MVQLDGAVAQVLPDAEADIPVGGWKKCIFKFSSIRAPGLEGFEEREGCRGVRPSRREIIIVSCSVNHMPQTHDASMLVPFSVRVRADERNCGGGPSFVRNGATTSLGVGSGKQQPQCYQCCKNGKPPDPKNPEHILSIHCFSPSSFASISLRFMLGVQNDRQVQMLWQNAEIQAAMQ